MLGRPLLPVLAARYPRLYKAALAAKGNQIVVLDYPVAPRPRWGHGRPAHPWLEKLLHENREQYRHLLRSFLAYRLDLARIPVRDARAGEPSWLNGWLPGLDAAALYALIRQRRPRTYVEVGSGNSTRFVRRAILDGDLTTRVVSIDPKPRADVDPLCDVVVRTRLEDVDLALFDQLCDDDIVFIDGSHRSLMNSDATVALLDVLPRLAAGVLVQFHDVLLPFDYPHDLAHYYYSEQYVLAAYLLGGTALEVVLPNAYVSADAELRSVLDPLWVDLSAREIERHGSSFWVRVSARAPAVTGRTAG